MILVVFSTGYCNNSIYLWEPTGSTWNEILQLDAKTKDLQWSPTERFAFASYSVNGNISIRDTRLGKLPAISIKADVNVITWNSFASCMLASGSDDGAFSIRDVRFLKEGGGQDSVVAHFEYYKHPITSIEWSPHDASTLAVSSSDNQLISLMLICDLSVEEEAESKADLPPQLCFVHQSVASILSVSEEVHWHSRIPGMVISTYALGFNVLMPSNTGHTANDARLKDFKCFCLYV